MEGKVKNIHIRHCLLFLYDENNDISGVDAARKLQVVYGDEIITERTCQKWLKRFRQGERNVEDLEDDKRSGRPSNFDENALKTLVEEDPKITIRDLADLLHSSIGNVHKHLHAIGKACFLSFSHWEMLGFKAWKLGTSSAF
jgi:histone-lysine N-methyltransferase SETMAR